MDRHIHYSSNAVEELKRELERERLRKHRLEQEAEEDRIRLEIAQRNDERLREYERLYQEEQERQEEEERQKKLLIKEQKRKEKEEFERRQAEEIRLAEEEHKKREEEAKKKEEEIKKMKEEQKRRQKELQDMINQKKQQILVTTNTLKLKAAKQQEEDTRIEEERKKEEEALQKVKTEEAEKKKAEMKEKLLAMVREERERLKHENQIDVNRLTKWKTLATELKARTGDSSSKDSKEDLKDSRAIKRPADSTSHGTSKSTKERKLDSDDTSKRDSGETFRKRASDKEGRRYRDRRHSPESDSRGRSPTRTSRRKRSRSRSRDRKSRSRSRDRKRSSHGSRKKSPPRDRHSSERKRSQKADSKKRSRSRERESSKHSSRERFSHSKVDDNKKHSRKGSSSGSSQSGDEGDFSLYDLTVEKSSKPSRSPSKTSRSPSRDRHRSPSIKARSRSPGGHSQTGHPDQGKSSLDLLHSYDASKPDQKDLIKDFPSNLAVPEGLLVQVSQALSSIKGNDDVELVYFADGMQCPVNHCASESRFYKRDQLITHWNEIHSSRCRTYSCKICQQNRGQAWESKSRGQAYRHFFSLHPIEAEGFSEENLPMAHIDVTSEINPYYINPGQFELHCSLQVADELPPQPKPPMSPSRRSERSSSPYERSLRDRSRERDRRSLDRDRSRERDRRSLDRDRSHERDRRSLDKRERSETPPRRARSELPKTKDGFRMLEARFRDSMLCPVEDCSCSVKFYKLTNFVNHWTSIHFPRTYYIVCLKCDETPKKCKRSRDMWRHMRSDHKIFGKECKKWYHTILRYNESFIHPGRYFLGKDSWETAKKYASGDFQDAGPFPSFEEMEDAHDPELIIRMCENLSPIPPSRSPSPPPRPLTPPRAASRPPAPYDFDYGPVRRVPIDPYDDLPHNPVSDLYDAPPRRTMLDPYDDPGRPGRDPFGDSPRRPGPDPYDDLPRRPGQDPYDDLPRRPGPDPYDDVPRRPGPDPYDDVPRRPGPDPYDDVPRRPGPDPYDDMPPRPGPDPYYDRPPPRSGPLDDPYGPDRYHRDRDPHGEINRHNHDLYGPPHEADLYGPPGRHGPPDWEHDGPGRGYEHDPYGPPGWESYGPRDSYGPPSRGGRGGFRGRSGLHGGYPDDLYDEGVDPHQEPPRPPGYHGGRAGRGGPHGYHGPPDDPEYEESWEPWHGRGRGFPGPRGGGRGGPPRGRANRGKGPSRGGKSGKRGRGGIGNSNGSDADPNVQGLPGEEEEQEANSEANGQSENQLSNDANAADPQHPVYLKFKPGISCPVPECGNSFKYFKFGLFMTHWQSTHRKECTYYTCTQCASTRPQKSPSLEEMRKHFVKAHSDLEWMDPGPGPECFIQEQKLPTERYIDPGPYQF